MAYFHQRFALQPAPGEVMMAVGASRSARLFAMATAHHRFNYICPFPDGNGRISRLMSHAMAQAAGVRAHGLWSVSRGLARGFAGGPEGRAEYKQRMAWADESRQGDRDGRVTCRSRDWNCSPTGFCACVSISSITWTTCLTSKHSEDASSAMSIVRRLCRTNARRCFRKPLSAENSSGERLCVSPACQIDRRGAF